MDQHAEFDYELPETRAAKRRRMRAEWWVEARRRIKVLAQLGARAEDLPPDVWANTLIKIEDFLEKNYIKNP